MSVDITKENKLDPKYHKMYRAMIEKGNKLDEIYKSPDSFSKIFQSETTLEREKLQRYCETLIFREPVLFGKKAEEILWRRVFYEIIHIVKSNKKNLKCNSQIETMYRLHLSSAYGFYNHLILRFQSEFNSFLQLNGFLDFTFLSYEKPTHNINDNGNPSALKETLKRILHKFLLCLGDLSRYQIEYDPLGSQKLAFKYYQMALILIHTNGMPLNQLGTLYGSENYGCDAAYYYLYCLSCVDPFVSARENLRLLFVKNRKRYEEINNKKNIEREKSNELPLTELRTREIKKFLVLFLRIIDSILVTSSTILSSQSVNKTVLISNHQLQEMCQLCLQEFNACMFYTNKSNESEGDKSTYLSDELVFKLTMTILMTIEHLKKRRSNLTGSKTSIYFTTVAFSLIWLSHIVNHTVIRLQEALLNMNKRNNLTFKKSNDLDSSDTINTDQTEITTKIIQSNDSSSSDDQKQQSELKSTLKKRRDIRLLYGLRRRKHNSDSDTNESEDEIDDSNSGNEERNRFISESDEYESDNDKANTKTNIISSDKKPRKKNIAKFLDRENLSETELNFVSSDANSNNESSFEEMVKKNNIKKKEIETVTESSVTEEVPIIEDADTNETSNKTKQQPTLTTQTSLNFKEFSTQLYSCLSVMQDQDITLENSNKVSELGQNNKDNKIKDEFIDNEIYKCILNGNRSVEIPPGFEIYTNEAKEIEELGKKLATFQIETDTEMSIFNSSNTSSNSDLDAQDKNKSNNLFKPEILTENDSKALKIQDLKNSKILINLLQNEALLPTIKVFCDWLLCNKNIIQSISQVSTTLWAKLSVLLNCIPLEKQIANESICENDYVRGLIFRSFETKSWNSQPLLEDIHMRSFSGAIRLEHQQLEFDINKLNLLNVAEENLLRLCNLRRFGYLIASLSKSQSNEGGYGFFEYDVSKAVFKALDLTNNNKKISESINGNQLTKQDDNQLESKPQQSELKETRKFQLMKNMAQLRLEAEISQLESTYKFDDLNWSPYLVADTAALCHNLKLVLDLARSNKFIIIVPLVVIDNLDSIKKDSKQAREAIRWLETQFKQGNRFLRAQTHNEKIVANYDLILLKKKDLELWRFYQLIDCCKYFQEEAVLNNKNEDKRLNMITILINCELRDQKSQESIEIAKENMIQLENIKEFYEKWRQTNTK